MSEKPATFTAPESGRYHVVSGQEPHLARDCTGQCPIGDPVITGGSMKTFAENHPAFVEAMKKTGVSCAELTEASRQYEKGFRLLMAGRMAWPTDAQLRAAGIQLHADRLRAEVEASMTTRRARLAWRLAGLLSKARRRS